MRISKRALALALSVLMCLSLFIGVLPTMKAEAATADPAISNDSIKVKIGDLGQIEELNIVNNPKNRNSQEINFVMPNNTTNQNNTAHQWMGELIFATRTSDTADFSEAGDFVEVDTNRTLAAGGSTTFSNATENLATNPYITKTVNEGNVEINFIGHDLDSETARAIKGFDVKSVFDTATDDGSLQWNITITNKSDKYIEFGDIGLPMPWNNKYDSQANVYNQRVTAHTFAGADSGYAYAIRCSGEGNYILFTPVVSTGARIEYVDNWMATNNGVTDYRTGSLYTNWCCDSGGWQPGLCVYYVHARNIHKTGRGYFTDTTSLVLEPGASKTYSFKFSAVRAGDNSPQESAESSNNASRSFDEREKNFRSILYKEGMIDAIAVPSFQTAINMETQLDLHYDETKIEVSSVEILNVTENDPFDDEHIPDKASGAVDNSRTGRGLPEGNEGYSKSVTLVETKLVDGEYHHIYKLTFDCIGNNSVRVDYKLKVGEEWVAKFTEFEFNVLAELDQIVETHADWMANQSQDTNPDSKTFGIYSDWFISKEGIDGSQSSHWGDDWSHDNVNFMAMKNYLNPTASQVASLENYLIDFMWTNYMKNTQSSYIVANYLSASGISGTSSSPYTRTFSEMMEATAFFNMYRIMKAYPDLMEYRKDATFYLNIAYNIYNKRVGSGATGFYGEQQVPDMIEALYDEGMTTEGNTLKNKFANTKASSCIRATYPYGSEFAYDNTGEEGAFAAAKALTIYYPESTNYSNALNLMSMCNMKTRAMRGMQPTWYHYACPVFIGGESWWNFQYTASLAGSIMDDYLRYYEADNNTTAYSERLNYGAKLSNFNAVNMGQISSKSVGATSWRYTMYKGGKGAMNVNDGNAGVSGGNNRVMHNGWNDFSGEADEGVYGSLLRISADVVTDPIFGLFGYGCTVTENDGLLTVVPTDGFGKRVNLLDQKLYVEMVQDSVTAVSLKDGKLTLSVKCFTEAEHISNVKLTGAGFTDGYYAITSGGAKVGQVYINAHAGVAQFRMSGTGADVTLELIEDGENEAPSVEIKADTDAPQAIVPFNLSSSVIDDGAPANGAITYSWAVVSTPAGAEMTLGTPTADRTSVVGTKQGTYVVSLTVSDGDKAATETITLELSAPPERTAPVINAASGAPEAGNPSVADLTVDATADEFYKGTLAYEWTVKTTPEGATATIVNGDSKDAKLLADKPGDYTVTVKAIDAWEEDAVTYEAITGLDDLKAGEKYAVVIYRYFGQTASYTGPQGNYLVGNAGSSTLNTTTANDYSTFTFADGIVSDDYLWEIEPVLDETEAVIGYSFKSVGSGKYLDTTAVIPASETPVALDIVSGTSGGYTNYCFGSTAGRKTFRTKTAGTFEWNGNTPASQVTGTNACNVIFYKVVNGKVTRQLVTEQDVVISMPKADGFQYGANVITFVGNAPELPATMTAIHADGTLAADTVIWDEIEADKYAAEGSFTATGAFADGTKVAVTVFVVNGKSTNIAPLATPTGIIDDVGDLGGVKGLNDGFTPSSSSDTSHGVWHNWRGEQAGTAWVQYTWDKAYVIDKVSIYYFRDGSGNFLPKDALWEYLNGDGEWVVLNAQPNTINRNAFNTSTFPAVSTTAIRLTMNPATLGCGVIEWQVYGYTLDKAALEAAIAAAKALTADETLTAAIAAAEDVLANSSSQEEIDAAAALLNAIVNLNKAIAAAATTNASLVESGCPALLDDSIAAANAVYTDAAADVEAINAAIAALNADVTAAKALATAIDNLNKAIADAEATDLTYFVEEAAAQLAAAIADARAALAANTVFSSGYQQTTLEQLGAEDTAAIVAWTYFGGSASQEKGCVVIPTALNTYLVTTSDSHATITGATLPAEAFWTFTATEGGYFIKNASTSEYLDADGMTNYVSLTNANETVSTIATGNYNGGDCYSIGGTSYKLRFSNSGGGIQKNSGAPSSYGFTGNACEITLYKYVSANTLAEATTNLNNAVTALKAAVKALRRVRGVEKDAAITVSVAGSSNPCASVVTALNDDLYGDSSTYANIDTSVVPLYHTQGTNAASNTITYTWETPVTINAADIFFWYVSSSGNVRWPTGYTLAYLDGRTSQYVNVKNAVGYARNYDDFNLTKFDEVTTTSLRLTVTKSSSRGMGIQEFKVYGKAYDPETDPNAAPVATVTAAVSGMKADLTATYTDDGRPYPGEITSGWEIISAPEGAVAILSADTGLTTTLYGSALGDYVLEFTICDGDTETGVATQQVTVTLQGGAVAGEDVAPSAAQNESDYTSSWENLDGINNPDFEPTSSNVGTGQGWGNWSQTVGTDHYVGYIWSSPVTIASGDIYWYDDNGGTKVPSKFWMKYKDASGEWQDVNLTSSMSGALVKNKYNALTFDQITTTNIRFYVTNSAAGCGIYRLKFYSALSLDSIQPVFMVTKAGETPVLPATATANTADGGTVTVPVIWESVAADAFAEPGTVTVKGLNPSTGLIVEATITVVAADAELVIESVDPVELTTTAGTVPALPATATVNFVGGGKDNQTYVINWPSIKAADLKEIGDYEFEGSIEGSELTVKLTIHVVCDHTYAIDEENSIAPTCTEEGVTKYVCSGCGDSYTEPVAALGHDFVYTSNNNGTHTITCSRCDFSATEDCDTLGEDGACSACGYKAEIPDEYIWTDIPAVPGGDAQYIYTLDTDGIDSGSKYLLAGGLNDVVAAREDGHSTDSEDFYGPKPIDVVIAGDTITLNTDAYEWTITGNSAEGYVITDGTHYINPAQSGTGAENSVLVTTSAKVTVTALDTPGAYEMKNNRYLYYDSNRTIFRSSSYATQAIVAAGIRLFKQTSVSSATGSDAYSLGMKPVAVTVVEGTALADVIAALKEAGFKAYKNATQTVEGAEDITDAVTITGYKGTVVGEQTLTVAYGDITLGTLTVTVEAAPVVPVKPTYEAISGLDDLKAGEKYVIVLYRYFGDTTQCLTGPQGNYIFANSATNGGNTVTAEDFKTMTVDFNDGIVPDIALWEIEPYGTGYSVKNVETGKYLDTTAVTAASDTPVALDIVAGTVSGYTNYGMGSTSGSKSLRTNTGGTDIKWNSATPAAAAAGTNASNIIFFKVVGTSAPATYEHKIISTSDFQWGSHTDYQNTAKTILEKMAEIGVTGIELALLGGDYVDGSVYADGSDTSDSTMISRFNQLKGYMTANWADIQFLAIQGNHDAAHWVTGEDAVLNPTGAYEFDDYVVYLLNEDDFPWWQAGYSTYSDTAVCKAKVEETSANLERYLVNMINSGDQRPVIIMSHVPMHWTTRTTTANSWWSDNIYAKILFDVINEAARKLDIVFLFGHNHSEGYADAYPAGGSVNLFVPGDTIRIPDGTVARSGNYTEETINFIYTNCGYSSYVSAGNNNNPAVSTMSVITITESLIKIEKYSKDGAYTTFGNYERARGQFSKVTPSLDMSSATNPKFRAQGDTETFTSLLKNGTDAVYSWTTDNAAVVKFLSTDGADTTVEYIGGGDATITLTVTCKDEDGFTQTLTADVTVSVKAAHILEGDIYNKVTDVTLLEDGAKYVIIASASNKGTLTVPAEDKFIIPESVMVDNSGNVITEGTASRTGLTMASAVDAEADYFDAFSGDYTAYQWTFHRSLNGWYFEGPNGQVLFSGTSSTNTLVFGETGTAFTIAEYNNTDTFTFTGVPSGSTRTYYWQIDTRGVVVGSRTAGNSGHYFIFKLGDITPIEDRVDHFNLQKAIAEAEALNEATYSVDSWAALQAELEAARAADALEETTQAALDEAEAALRAAIAALETKLNETIRLIGEIGEVTLESKDAIEAAREHYDGLGNSDKNRVTNYQTLVEAEVAYLKLLAEQAGGEVKPNLDTLKTTAKETVTSLADFVGKDLDSETKAQLDAILADALAAIDAAEDADAVLAAVDAAIAAINAFGPCDHDYQLDEEKFVAPTCLENGAAVYVCSKCGATYSNVIEPTGHEYEDTVTEPTCTDYGFTTHTCIYCGDTEIDSIVEALGHEYENGVCIRCGEKDPDAVDPCEGYTDINRDLWYHDAVDFVIANGYMGSTSTDALTFEPNTKVTRAMVASIMYRIAGNPEVEYKASFTDVKEGKWFTAAIEWAAQNGLAAGKGDGKFDPNGNVTRQELAVFMYKLAEFQGKDVSAADDLANFADAAKVPAWAKAYVQWAVAAGLISGKGQKDGTTLLAPVDNATRAEFASIIMRFINN